MNSPLRCNSFAAPRPHDLLWIRHREDLISLTALPLWASVDWLSMTPVVVRRERTPEQSLVPVGLRGRTRSERHAAYLHGDRILRRVTPEVLARTEAWTQRAEFADAPCIQALTGLAGELNARHLIWGITGSVGFALATGILAMRHDSDLDLLVRAPQRISRDEAVELIDLLGRAPVRIDVQVETDHGAFALAEWASACTRVLLKTGSGPLLVDDPWQRCTTLST